MSDQVIIPYFKVLTLSEGKDYLKINEILSCKRTDYSDIINA